MYLVIEYYEEEIPISDNNNSDRVDTCPSIGGTRQRLYWVDRRSEVIELLYIIASERNLDFEKDHEEMIEFIEIVPHDESLHPEFFLDD